MKLEQLESILSAAAPTYHSITLMTPMGHQPPNLRVQDGTLCLGSAIEDAWMPITHVTATPGGLVLLECVFTDKNGNEYLEATMMTATQVRVALEEEKQR